MKGLSGARNTGIAASTGEIIAFLDDDAFAEREWLEQLTRPFADPKVAGSGGWIVPNWEVDATCWFPKTFYWVLGCSYEGLPLDGSHIRNPIGASMAVRRTVFSKVGGFTPGIGRIGLIPLGCEETELCIRYSSLVPTDYFVLARNAVVHHRVPTSRLTWGYFWTRCWAEGLSKAAVASLVGANDGFSSERRHVAKVLPRELWRSFCSLRRNTSDAAKTISLILLGSASAAAGVLRGRVAVRRHPIRVACDELGLLIREFADEEGGGGSPRCR
jgi:glycosyltransferase involved in cell wall biosynthesis